MMKHHKDQKNSFSEHCPKCRPECPRKSCKKEGDDQTPFGLVPGPVPQCTCGCSNHGARTSSGSNSSGVSSTQEQRITHVWDTQDTTNIINGILSPYMRWPSSPSPKARSEGPGEFSITYPGCLTQEFKHEITNAWTEADPDIALLRAIFGNYRPPAKRKSSDSSSSSSSDEYDVSERLQGLSLEQKSSGEEQDYDGGDEMAYDEEEVVDHVEDHGPEDNEDLEEEGGESGQQDEDSEVHDGGEGEVMFEGHPVQLVTIGEVLESERQSSTRAGASGDTDLR
ncbi:hypothetical protein F4810DRAFT_665849 [Camillea tinctor]|nr:hypothetical protein F4810DRAFT_665849 [Camillea tinctor]